MANKRTQREFLLKFGESGARATRRKIEGLQNQTGKLTDGLKTFRRIGVGAFAAVGIAAAGTSVAVGATVGALIKTGIQVENLQAQFKTVLKSEEEAIKKMTFIRNFAATTPFQVSELTEAGVRLEQFGFKVEDTLATIGDAAGALDKPIIQAAEAIADAAAGEFERLKEFGITTSKITAELGREVSRKTEQDLRDNVDAIMRIMQRDFGGGMANLAGTFSGQMSMFSDAWFNLKADIAAGGIFDLLKQDLKDTLELVNRFTDEGGVDAIALGFNNAFTIIHETFFDPMLRGFDDISISAQKLALDVEIFFLGAAEKVARFTTAIQFKGFGGTPESVRRLQEELGILEVIRDTIAGTRPPTSLIELMRIYQAMSERGLTTVGLGPTSAEEAAAAKIVNDFDKATDAIIAAAQEVAATPELRGGVAPGFEGPVLMTEKKEEENEALLTLEAERLQVEAEMMEAHQEGMDDRRLQSMEFYVSTLEFGKEKTRDIYSQMLKFQSIFTRKGMNLGRAMNAFLIRGAGEVAKAGIQALTRKAKIEALSYAADALALLAQRDFAGAATMAKAALGKGAIAGAAGLANAVIDREVGQREQALIGESTGIDDTFDSGGRPASERTGIARTVRTAPMTNNFNIILTNQIQGDYIIQDGDQNTAEQILEVFESGLVPLQGGV